MACVLPSALVIESSKRFAIASLGSSTVNSFHRSNVVVSCVLHLPFISFHRFGHWFRTTSLRMNRGNLSLISVLF